LFAAVSRRLVPVLALALLSACASRPSQPVVKPAVKKIALVPAAEPRSITFESRSTAGLFVPVLGMIAAADARSRQGQISAALQVGRMGMGDRLTQQLAGALREAGYEVEIVTDLKRPADDPDNIDILALNTAADAVFQLRVVDVGIYSGLFSANYVPRVVTYGVMYSKDGGYTFYDAEVHYGAHAEKGKDWAVEGDPKHAYTGPDDILAKADDVKAAFMAGIVASGTRIAQQVLAALK
jgi:hypothetical protein